MEHRRTAELLVVRLRWAALIAAALVIDDYAAAPLAALAIFGVFYYNTIAALIVSDKLLFDKYGSFFAVAVRVLDLSAIALASCAGVSDSRTFYLLYCFVIVGTGYLYSRIRPIVVAVAASVALDLSCVLYRLLQTGSANQAPGQVIEHAAAFAAAGLVTTYIIAFRKQHETMRTKERKLSALFECGTRFTSAKDLPQLLNHILDTAVSETDAAGGLIMLIEPEMNQPIVAAERWLDPEVEESMSDRSVEKWVATSGHPAFTPGTLDDDAFGEPIEGKSAICVPLIESTPSSMSGTVEKNNIKVVGTLSVYGRRYSRPFGREDVDLLRMLAIHASMGVVNSGLYQELHDRFLNTLQSLARSLEARDPYTQGHSYRVSEISLLVAQSLGLSAQSAEALRNAALLHDIGKIGVPDGVLRKPGKLTPEERLIIQTHPSTGENICRPLEMGEEVLFLIRHHQERLNGTGYPDQLPAYQQSLALRILCAVDALDAMSSDRPYRKALNAAERVEQLDKAAGIEFDRQVVEVLKSLLSSKELDRFYTTSQDDDEMMKAA